MKKLILIMGLCGVTALTGFAQQSMDLSPSKDNTLFEDVSGNLSSGSGTSIYSGQTGATGSEALRRAVIAFDFSNIPAGATITKVTLKLNLEQGKGSNSSMSLHSLTSNWGEGSSISPAGQGAQAQNNDATWIHTFYNAQMWTTPGGDYTSTASATTNVSTTAMTYEWTSAQMLADVQGWIADGATNFGWILIGDETSQSAKKFASKEHATVSLRPVLTVEYTEDKSSVAQLNAADISVYPNPTTDKVTIKLNSNFNNATVEVVDLLGNVISSTTLNTNATISIADKPKGIYYVIVKTEKGTVTKKITKL